VKLKTPDPYAGRITATLRASVGRGEGVLGGVCGLGTVVGLLERVCVAPVSAILDVSLSAFVRWVGACVLVLLRLVSRGCGAIRRACAPCRVLFVRLLAIG